MRTYLLAFVVLLSFVVSACGGGDSDESTEDVVEAPTESDQGPVEEPATTVAVETLTVISPPTTRGPAPSLDLEPLTGISAVTVVSDAPAYLGVLGQIAADRNLVPAVALPPAAAAPGIAPLTGLALEDPSVAQRPAIVAKIDNTEKGRPQEALSQADIVFVTEVEGGFTRLVAVFHSQTPAELGPVRSGRTTDISLVSSFNTPIYVWSGANSVHLTLLRRSAIFDLGATRRSEYYRAADRPGTYDLMIDPSVLWGIAAADGDGGTPPVHFEYRDDTIGLPPSAVPASAVRIDYPAAGVDWKWDTDFGFWRRVQNGTPHVDAQNAEVRAANVLVAEVSKVSTGLTDGAGSPVPEQQFVGSGRGWVFTDGHAIEVTWTKPSLASVPTWTTPDGVPVALTPGQTWIELVPAGGATFS